KERNKNVANILKTAVKNYNYQIEQVTK
ncbi:MAG: hypothetical protein RLZ12_657, partial [Bacillota bacterium]